MANLGQISQSNFEIIRDLISFILKDEMDNQAILRNDQDYTADFYTERFHPIDVNEGNVICVDIVGGDLSHQTPVSQSFNCAYNIDIYTNAIETTDNTGYYNSAIKLHRLAGLARKILQSPYYDRLTVQNGIVERRSVESIQFARINDEQDSNYVRMGRVILNVRLNETQEEITPISTAGYDTIMKIEETEKGYRLTYNNE